MRRPHRAVGAYLASETLSLLGNAVIAVALPLLVLERTGSVAAAGVVAAAGAVPSVAAGLLGGLVVDRVDRRRVSVAADLLSGAAVAALPLVDRVWGLDLLWFVVLAAIGAFGDLPGMAARDALAPPVAERSGVALERLIAAREALGALALVVGPAVAGLLLWLLATPTVMWVTAATSTLAALVTLAVPPALGDYARYDELPTSARAAVRQSVAGFGVVAADPLLRVLVGLGIASVAVLGTVHALLLPVHFAALGEPGLLGTVLSAMALGLLAGAAGYAALAPRLDPGHWFVLGLLVATLGLGAVLALAAYPVLIAGAVLAGVGSAPVNAVAGAALVGRVHEGLRGRVLAAQNTVMMLAVPVVILPVGLLAEATSARTAGIALGGLWLAAVGTVLVRSPLRSAHLDDGDAAAPDGQPAQRASAATDGSG